MSGRTQHYRKVGKDDLTARQREVLQLVAEGKTNPEIAERLGITLDGAKFHIREILAKLGVDSREEAAEWWRSRRGIGTRVASWMRGLAPAAWLKPAAIGTAVGGTTLGLVAVGFAVNGGGGGEDGASAALSDCDTATLTWTARSVMDSDPNIGLRYVLSATAPAECVLNAVLGVTGWGSTPDAAGGTFSFHLGGPIAVSIEKQLLGPNETPLIVGNAANVCNGGVFVMVVLTAPTQTSYFLPPPLPPCEDPAAGARFTAQWSANAIALAPKPATPWWTQLGNLPTAVAPPTAVPTLTLAPPDSPACDPLSLKGSWAYAIDEGLVLRWSWSVDTPVRCILSLNQHASVTVTYSGPTAPAEPYVASARLSGGFLYQELGAGTNTVFVGTVKNTCSADAGLHFAFELSNAKAFGDVGSVPSMCTDRSRPAELEASWAIFTSAIPRHTPAAPSPPYWPVPTSAVPPAPTSTDPFFQIYAAIDGDTVASFAGRYYLTPADILAANPGLGPDAIPSGTRVRVPIRGQTPTPAPSR